MRDNLSSEQIATLLDPTQYTGASSLLAEQFAKQARKLAAELNATDI